MRKAMIVLAVLAAFVLGLLIRGGGAGGDAAPAGADAAPTVWTCSMHPQFQLPEAGQCPICFMDLIPLEEDAGDGLGPRDLALSEAGAALADIRTAPVERRAVEVRTRLTGRVDYDETRTRTIAAWVPGRIDSLHVAFTGARVNRGQPLATLYSPKLYTAQVELLSAREAEHDLAGSPDADLRRTSAATTTAARERLRLWGLSDDQIAAIERRGTARHHTTLDAPLDGVVVHKAAVEGRYVETGTPLYTVADLDRVWVTLDAYETDLAWLAEGRRVAFGVQALPGREFEGEVVFIDPVIDPATRTARVRLEAGNADGRLKPGMFVRAVADGEAGADGDAPLVIPATAPLITGERAVVYVRRPDRDQPTFEGREIVLGPRAGDWYVVAEGLDEGEEVVHSGAFKIDSALQIQAKPSMMNPGGGGPAPGHDHGPGGSDAPAAPETLEAPAPFLAALTPVVDAYLALQTALAGDDDSAAAAAAANGERAVETVPMDLAGPAHAAWMDDAAHLGGAFAAIAGADGIEARRKPLQALTDALWGALVRYGYADDRVVRLFHCPMAYRGDGGDWLQLGTDTANPYFGASMLRCGGQTDSLAARDGEAR